MVQEHVQMVTEFSGFGNGCDRQNMWFAASDHIISDISRQP